MTQATAAHAPAHHSAHRAQASHARNGGQAGAAANGSAGRGAAGAAPTSFADMLRSQADEPVAAADNAPATETEASAEATPATPEAPTPPARPRAAENSPSPGEPGTPGAQAQNAQATPGESDPGQAALDALRDAMAGSHGVSRRPGTGPAGQADAQRASRQTEAEASSPAEGRSDFAQTLERAQQGAEPLAAAVERRPEPVTPVAAVPEGQLPSLGPTDATPTPAAPPETPPVPVQAQLPQPPHSPGFAPALGVQLSTWLKDGVQHASLELNPADLGPIDVRIAVRDGQTQVALAADVASTRAALAEALPQLAASLGDVGLSLSGGSVSDQGAGRRDGGQPGASPRVLNTGALAGLGGTEADIGAARPAAKPARGLLDLYA